MLPNQRFANEVLGMLKELLDKVNAIGAMLEDMKGMEEKETPANEGGEPAGGPSEDELRAMALERLKQQQGQ